jgi:hypothetical protein
MFSIVIRIWTPSVRAAPWDLVKEKDWVTWQADDLNTNSAPSSVFLALVLNSELSPSLYILSSTKRLSDEVRGSRSKRKGT